VFDCLRTTCLCYRDAPFMLFPFFCCMTRPPPISTLFPYTTLFRSLGVAAVKIAVAGCGYVGLSIATLLAQHQEVVALDIDAEKVAAVNAGRSPIADPELAEYLASGRLQLHATTSATEALAGAAFVVIATPTDYD